MHEHHREKYALFTSGGQPDGIRSIRAGRQANAASNCSGRFVVSTSMTAASSRRPSISFFPRLFHLSLTIYHAEAHAGHAGMLLDPVGERLRMGSNPKLRIF